MVDKPSSSPNRIPAKHSGEWQSWRLPSVGGNKPSIKAEQNTPERATGTTETIEDLDVEGLGSTGLTAQQMSDIVQAAEQEGFAQGYNQGQQQGYQEGYQQGQERGGEDIRQQLSREQQTFASLVQALQEPINRQDDALETLLLTMVERLSRAVVERDLATQPADIIALVHQSVAALPTPGNDITLHLNQAEHDGVQRYAQEHGYSWRLQVDPTIAAGGVKVSTPISVVDNTLERRLDEVLERFIQRQDLDETTSDEQLQAREQPIPRANTTDAAAEEQAPPPDDGAQSYTQAAPEQSPNANSAAKGEEPPRD
jgi:flagellar assembly protein FliH